MVRLPSQLFFFDRAFRAFFLGGSLFTGRGDVDLVLAISRCDDDLLRYSVDVLART